MAERRTNQEFRQANASVVSAVTVRPHHVSPYQGWGWRAMEQADERYAIVPFRFQPALAPHIRRPSGHGKTSRNDWTQRCGKVNPATVIPMCHLHEASAHHVNCWGAGRDTSYLASSSRRTSALLFPLTCMMMQGLARPGSKPFYNFDSYGFIFIPLLVSRIPFSKVQGADR